MRMARSMWPFPVERVRKSKARYHKFTGDIPVVFVEDAKKFISSLGVPMTETSDKVSPDFMHEVDISGVKMLVFSEGLLRTLYGVRVTPIIESHLALWKGTQRHPDNTLAAFKYAMRIAERFNRPKCHEILRRKLAEMTKIELPPMSSVAEKKSKRPIENILFSEQRRQINEVANTIAADVNEIMLGYYMLGGKWTGFQGAADAQQQLELRKEALSAAEFADAIGRAQAMAEEVKAWASSNGFKGKVKKVWWTARPGVLAQAVGQEVDSRKNPTDTLVQFSDDKFLGLSAKATKSSGDIGFKNPGLGTIEKALGLSLSSMVQMATKTAIEKYNLPKPAARRKKAIRADSKIQSETNEMGLRLLRDLRDALYKKLKTLSQDELKAHLIENWMDADIVYPPYIKVTGRGKDGNYSADVMDPLKNPKLKALASENVKLSKIGDVSIGVTAGKKNIMKMRFKFESEKLASSVKMSGDPW